MKQLAILANIIYFINFCYVLPCRSDNQSLRPQIYNYETEGTIHALHQGAILKEGSNNRGEVLIVSHSSSSEVTGNPWCANRYDAKTNTINLTEGGIIATNSKAKLSTGGHYLVGCSLIVIQAVVGGTPYAYAAVHLSCVDDFKILKKSDIKISDLSGHPIQIALTSLKDLLPKKMEEYILIGIIVLNEGDEYVLPVIKKIWGIKIPEECIYSYGKQGNKVANEKFKVVFVDFDPEKSRCEVTRKSFLLGVPKEGFVFFDCSILAPRESI